MTKPVAVRGEGAEVNISSSNVPARRERPRSSPNVDAMPRRPSFPSHRFASGITPVQTMSMMSVITAIFVSITLSTTIIIAVVCCRRTGLSRRRRRTWAPRRGPGYAATADVVACEMEEFDGGSLDQCSLSTTADDVHHSQQLPLNNDGRSSRARPTVPTGSGSVDSLSTRSATRLLRPERDDEGCSTDDDLDDSLRDDDLRPLHDQEDSSSTCTNETAFSEDVHPAAAAASSLHVPQTERLQSSLESGHI